MAVQMSFRPVPMPAAAETGDNAGVSTQRRGDLFLGRARGLNLYGRPRAALSPSCAIPY